MQVEEHLNRLLPETRDVLSRSDEERVYYIQEERWIPYPLANDIFSKLEKMLTMPRRSRMPSMLIVGDSNNGKSSLVKKFYRAHPPTDGLGEDAYPVMYIESCPSEPDEKLLYDFIFMEIEVPFRYSDSPSKKIADLLYYFEKLGTRMLILDEIHNSVTGSANKQRVFMNALKNLSNRLSMPIVLVGTKDALHVVNTDMQIKSRFRPVVLPDWKLDRDFVQFLAGIETTLPLRNPSNLTTRELATEIYERAGGYIGNFVELLREAAITAVNSGSEQITLKEIKTCDFNPPLKESVI